MKTSSYWELTEHERAALSEHDVEDYVGYELMRAGVVRVTEPEEPVTLGRPSRDMAVYRLRSVGCETEVAWRTPEQAAQALQGLVWLSTEYFHGDYSNRVLKADKRETEVVGIEAYSVNAYDVHKSELERLGAQEKELVDARKEYEQSCAKQRDALDGMWSDWRRCQRLSSDAEEVAATLAEYTRLTSGDQTMAAEFLSKAYDLERIEAANDWNGDA